MHEEPSTLLRCVFCYCTAGWQHSTCPRLEQRPYYSCGASSTSGCQEEFTSSWSESNIFASLHWNQKQNSGIRLTSVSMYECFLIFFILIQSQCIPKLRVRLRNSFLTLLLNGHYRGRKLSRWPRLVVTLLLWNSYLKLVKMWVMNFNSNPFLHE